MHIARHENMWKRIQLGTDWQDPRRSDEGPFDISVQVVSAGVCLDGMACAKWEASGDELPEGAFGVGATGRGKTAED